MHDPAAGAVGGPYNVPAPAPVAWSLMRKHLPDFDNTEAAQIWLSPATTLETATLTSFAPVDETAAAL